MAQSTVHEFPDPSTATLIHARAYFQSLLSESFTLHQLARETTSRVHQWSATYSSSAYPPSLKNLSKVRHLFQNAVQPSGLLTRIEIAELLSGLQWSITFRKNNNKTRCFPSCFKIFRTLTKSRSLEQKPISVNYKLQLSDKSSISLADYDQAKHNVRRILLNDKNVTNALTRSYSLTHKKTQLLVDLLSQNKTPVQIRDEFSRLKKEKKKPETIFTKGATIYNKMVNAPVKPAPIADDMRKHVLFSRLSSNDNISGVRKLLSLTCDFSQYLKVKHSLRVERKLCERFDVVPLRTSLMAAGIPTETQELLEVYLNFCKENKIHEDPYDDLAMYAYKISS